MVRQRSRRTIEEVYGTKFETTKPVANSTKNGGFQTNVHDNGYIINSNTPYYTTPAPQSSALNNNGALNSSRRRSTVRTNGKTAPITVAATHKIGANKEKEDIGKDYNSTKMLKTSRASGHDKSARLGGGGGVGGAATNQYYDNKTYRPYIEHNKEYHVTSGNDGQQQHHHQHQHQQQQQHHNKHQHVNHHHHHQPHHQDEDKDDDTEEFFQLIRQTVENAIGKSISELLNRNFRELSSKIDRFSMELKSTNDQMKKMHMELNNKISHYGEENSRHFRYLCMKSEYDKMFYQHQTMMSAAVVPSKNRPVKLDKRLSAVHTKSPNNQTPNSSENDAIPAPCTCRSVINNKSSSKDPQKSLSNDRNDISRKSSEDGIREILEQFQRFFTEMKELKNGPNSARKMSEMTLRNDKECGAARASGAAGDVMASYHQEKALRINRELFQENYDEVDDDFEMSSDSISPRSVENLDIPHQYNGGMTVRTSNTSRTQHITGGGDGDGGDAM
ncbi:rho GTPase-activating protein gacF [Musca domestica]|uniref:Rho GTPase-activating protein gacF n=1 Tax=Musca domestica TaxID=7370 RepID=A0A1I8N5N7_MUSDO|nr:rho GTPase-activating protein gacF [Musca domestica]